MKSGFIFALFPAALFLTFLQGCAENGVDDNDLRTSFLETSLHRQEITAGSFRLTVFSRIRDTNRPVTVYIEGDVPGLAPGADPGIDSTPDDTVGLRLASIDPSDNVIFISRPCQFNIDDFACKDILKNTLRWADQYYASANRALDYVLSPIPHPHVNLVGYSGGGALAAVLAARRHDIVSLRTIAGNMDPHGNGRFHATDPQDDFIDPMMIASRLAGLPQEHFVGGKDDFVPPFLTENFIKAIGTNACATVTRVPDATHTAGWESAWRKYATKTPTCNAEPRQVNVPQSFTEEIRLGNDAFAPAPSPPMDAPTLETNEESGD